eukprot:46735_1
MALFDATNWVWIVALTLGGIMLTIVICIVIYLCRRRCVKRRIQEALEIQENYLAATMPSPQISHVPSSSNQATDDVAPIVKMKSLNMVNIAEESDDEPPEPNSSGTNINLKANKLRTHILDLSSDVGTPVGGTSSNTKHVTHANGSISNGKGMNLSKAPPAHVQQTSFVLDSEVDYYTQVQEMDSDYRRGTVSHQTPATTNTDIIDDEEEDIELDYGPNM